MTKATRVLIVDDHPMVAEGIASILEIYDDVEVVGMLLPLSPSAPRAPVPT
ncbi:MAG: DNA-binding response regulator, partial [Pseudomonadota bacterium]